MATTASAAVPFGEDSGPEPSAVAGCPAATPGLMGQVTSCHKPQVRPSRS